MPHAVQPVVAEVVKNKGDHPNKPTGIKWPLNMRWPLALWNTVFVPSGSYQNKPSNDAAWNRGAYLVQSAGHCGACHTPRSVTMNEKALDESSAVYLSGALLDGWYAPSLRQDVNTGLGRWSEDDIYQFLKNGRNQHAVVFGSMTEAYNNSTQFMSDDDLKAIAHYLKSLPGDPARDGGPWTYQEMQVSASSANPAPGASTYAARCGFCHGPDGRGQNQWVPPLAGAASSLIEHTVGRATAKAALMVGASFNEVPAGPGNRRAVSHEPDRLPRTTSTTRAAPVA